jgi:hypothetical protein
VKKDLQKLYDSGYRSLAIVFVHSYTFPTHELQVGDIARSIGFTQVSESSQLLPMIKMVPRGVSSTADAYLTPILRDYLDGFFSGFDEKLRDGRVTSPRVEFMGSDGGLLDLNNFSGLKSILSGPAGGVVGYALTSWDEQRKHPIIGYVFPFLSPLPVLTRADWTSEAPRQMYPALTADTKSCTKPLQRGLRSNHPSWISTPWLRVVGRVWRSAMGSFVRAPRAQVRNRDRRVIGP